jgi:repressor LexA
MRTLKILKKEQIGALIGEKLKGVGTTIALPLMGYIAAGSPLEPHSDPEATMDVASSMISGKRTSYALQVKGNSMIEDGIFDGDFVVVEKTDVCSEGDIVVALVDDNLATLKRFYKKDGKIVLMPSNSEMDPIYPNECRIQGVVTGLVRKFTN